MLLTNSYHFTYMYKIYIMSMVIEDSHLFVIHMTCYIFVNRIIIPCTRSLNSALQI